MLDARWRTLCRSDGLAAPGCRSGDVEMEAFSEFMDGRFGRLKTT
jgi:hypothetical protein